MKETITKIPKYTNNPKTAAPRRSKPDQAMYQAQRKLEEAMHMNVHLAQTRDLQHLTVSTALMRSAWEDLQQSRRHLMAGKQSYKLEPRAGDQTTRLLSKEEEKRIRTRPIQRWKPQQQPNVQAATSSQDSTWQKPAWRGRSQTRGKGKGKGARSTSANQK